MCSSPPWPALSLQTNIVQTIINSLSVFTDFGQHSRWISPDNIDYYKSCRMVSISKSSFWFPYSFSISVSQYGFNFDFARGSTCRLSHNRQRARQTTSVKNTVGRSRTLGPAQSSMHDLVLISFTRLLLCHSLKLAVSIHTKCLVLHYIGRLSSMMIPKFISTWKSRFVLNRLHSSN